MSGEKGGGGTHLKSGSSFQRGAPKAERTKNLTLNLLTDMLWAVLVCVWDSESIDWRRREAAGPNEGHKRAMHVSESAPFLPTMPVEGESVEERAKPTRSYAYVPEEPSGQQGGSVRKDLGKAPRGDAGGQGSGMRRSVSFAKKTGVVETRSTPSAAKATAASDAPIAPRRSISYASALPAEFMDSSGGLKMGSQANEASIEKQLTAKMVSWPQYNHPMPPLLHSSQGLLYSAIVLSLAWALMLSTE